MNMQSAEEYRKLIDSLTGFERAWAYISWTNIQNGYYSPDELISLSLKVDFQLDSPFLKIRRGTKISSGVVIRNNSIIDGENVTIGNGTILDQAHISASDVKIGAFNVISGNISTDKITIGEKNRVRNIRGYNQNGSICVGNENIIEDVIINNDKSGQIVIGNHNTLCPGLNINNPFDLGKIKIGNYNILGDGGGGIVSSSYRFGNKWGGIVIIGSNVETKRGAEVLGFSLLGYSNQNISSIIGNEFSVEKLFADGKVLDVINIFEQLWDAPSPDLNADVVGLYGVVRIRRACAVGWTRIFDGAYIQNAYLRNAEIWDRCKIYFSTISSDAPIKIGVPDRVIEKREIHANEDWSKYPTVASLNDLFPPEDEQFYSKSS